MSAPAGTFEPTKRLYRIAGTNIRTKKFTRSVALIRAPDEIAALRIALAGHADHYQDLHVAAELADLP